MNKPETLPITFSGLTPKQTKALPLVALGHNAVEISKKIKVSQQQISEWKKNENFIHALENLRCTHLDDAKNEFRSLYTNAVSTLKYLLNHSKNESIKFRTATYIIDRLKTHTTDKPESSFDAQHDIDIDLLYTALGIKEQP